MADFRSSKSFNSSGTASDGYDVYAPRVDGLDIILAKDVNDLSDSIMETQKALTDGYAVTTLLPQAVSFEDGQTLVYDSQSEQMVAGASGDASLKIQAVADPQATIKAGFLILGDGRELSVSSDLSINLDTVLGSDPTDATTYYLYVDLNTLDATSTSSTGRVTYELSEASFALSIETPEDTDLLRFAPIGLVRSADTGTVWSGTGSAFETLAFRRHGSGGSGVFVPIVYINDTITNATSGIINHGANVNVQDQRWTVQLNGADGYISQLDNEWLIDIVDANNIDVDFSFLSVGDVATLKLENQGLSTVNAASVTAYDSGFVSASTLNAQLPITHGVAGVPTSLVLLQEVSAGTYETLDFSSFLSVTASEIDGDLSSLGATTIRVLASGGAQALISSLYSTSVTDQAKSVRAGDEVLVDSSSGTVTLTLPSTANTGDKVRVVDGTGNAATNNITIARNGLNIEGQTTDLVLDQDRAGVELVYMNAAQGWLILSL